MCHHQNRRWPDGAKEIDSHLLRPSLDTLVMAQCSAAAPTALASNMSSMVFVVGLRVANVYKFVSTALPAHQGLPIDGAHPTYPMPTVGEA